MQLKIGEVLSSLIKKQGLTLKEVSRAAKVPSSTLGEWKLNRPPKNPEQVLRVANALGVTIHFLLFGQEDGQEPIQRLIKDQVFSGTYEITIKKVSYNANGD